MQNTLYVTTVDDDKHTHNYRLPVTETVPEGHEITDVRPAGLFRLSAILSDENRKRLLAAGKRSAKK